MKFVANLSFGKDSLAMVLKLIELGYPLDGVVFYDSTAEFNCIYRSAEKMKALLQKEGITFTVLRPTNTFLYDMLERPVTKRNGVKQCGYKWCGGACRWGTSLKLQAIENHYKIYGDEAIVEYVGIAADERHRINRDRNGNKVKLYPLVEWNMTEADCLFYCYSKGWNWLENGVELYSILDRVSCKYCRNTNLRELYNIYFYLPELWQELKMLQEKIDIPFKDTKSIHELEEIFWWRKNQLSFDDVFELKMGKYIQKKYN